MDAQFINEVLELVNEERNNVGLNPLELDSQLTDVAEDHSESMAVNDFVGHQDPTDNSGTGDRIEEVGYEWSTWGENVAAGYSTPEDVMKGWMNSSGHRANILNPDFTEIGIGYEFLENDTGSVNYNHYWTQVFGTPQPNINTNSIEDASVDNSSLITELTGLINQERTESGFDSLAVDEQLSQAAQQHSNSMAINDFVAHNSLDGSTPSQRIEETGYQGSFGGENIVVKSDNAEAIMDYLLTGSNSENIFNSEFTEIGIGYEFLENDTGSVNHNHYLTIDFGVSEV